MNKKSVPNIYIYKQIVDAKLFIDANFQKKIDLETIATKACFSKFHFHRVFKECYKKTPLEYLTHLRLNESKILLSQGFSIQEVCYSVGFESTSSFIKLFKKNELVTPMVFSKTAKTKREKLNESPLSYIPINYARYLGWRTK